MNWQNNNEIEEMNTDNVYNNTSILCNDSDVYKGMLVYSKLTCHCVYKELQITSTANVSESQLQ